MALAAFHVGKKTAERGGEGSGMVFARFLDEGIWKVFARFLDEGMGVPVAELCDLFVEKCHDYAAVVCVNLERVLHKYC